MALVLLDRAKVTSTTAGTGTLTITGTSSGFQSLAGVGNGNTTYYSIFDVSTSDWEVGIGTYSTTGPTLSRDTVLSSSNAGSLVPFSSNAKEVFITLPASKAIPSIGTTSPTSPVQANLWWDSENGYFSIYYPDGTSNQFVATQPGGTNMDYSTIDGGSATTTSWAPLIFDGGGAT